MLQLHPKSLSRCQLSTYPKSFSISATTRTLNCKRPSPLMLGGLIHSGGGTGFCNRCCHRQHTLRYGMRSLRLLVHQYDDLTPTPLPELAPSARPSKRLYYTACTPHHIGSHFDGLAPKAQNNVIASTTYIKQRVGRRFTLLVGYRKSSLAFEAKLFFFDCASLTAQGTVEAAEQGSISVSGFYAANTKVVAAYCTLPPKLLKIPQHTIV